MLQTTNQPLKEAMPMRSQSWQNQKRFRHPSSLANDEDVLQSGVEGVAHGVLVS
jgi:hypothetical protein